MKKDDNNKVLKRILFLFIFVFVSASIILLKPNTLSKLQGNASSYNQKEASYEETGVVITTDYLIENLSSNDLKLYVYNGSNSDITITKIISKKIDADNYVEYAYSGESPGPKATTTINFNKDQLNCGDSNSVCSSFNSINLGSRNSISYQNFVIGIEYVMGENTYYLSSTALYLDTTKLNEDNIDSIRNIDNTKSATVYIHNLLVDENNKLITVPFDDAAKTETTSDKDQIKKVYFKTLENTGNKGEYKIDLKEKVNGKINYDYLIDSNNKVANINYNFTHNKYLFVDAEEKTTDNIDFGLDVSYEINNFNVLDKYDIIKIYEKYLITDYTEPEEKYDENGNKIEIYNFDVKNKYSYVPSGNVHPISIQGYYNKSYYGQSTKSEYIDSKKMNYKLNLDSNTFKNDSILLENKTLNQFYRKEYNFNNYHISVINSPVIVTKYNKKPLKKAILNGISKLRNASEDSIDVNSYVAYTDVLTTAIDLYSSRYIYKVNGNNYLVNDANIYQMTNILNNYKFKEKKKADYTEIDKTIEKANDALSKYQEINIIVEDKDVKQTLSELISDFNANHRNLSINYQSFIDNYKKRIEAELANFPVYTKDYMDIYNTAIKENPKVKIILLDKKKSGETIIERFRLIINKFNEEQIKVSFDNLKDYLFNGIVYESFYIDGDEEYLYPEEAWNNYYSELSKFYDEDTKPDFESMNFLEHQNIINESTENLKNAIKTLKDNVKVVDTSIMSDLIDLTNQGSYNEIAALISKDTYNEIINITKTLNKKLPLNETSNYNGMEVNNQAYFYNCIIDIYLRMYYDIIFNVDIDGLTIDGRNSREDLGYLTVEEYYNFFYNLNSEDYDTESFETVISTKTFEGLSDYIEFNEIETLDDKLFKKTFAEWYLEAIFVDVTFEEEGLELVEGVSFGVLQSVTYKLQDDFKYLKNLLTPKVGDYTEICNYYKVLTSLNLNYYETDTKKQIVDILWKINWSYKKDEQDKIDEQARELKEFIDGLSMRKADTNKLYEAYNNALKYDKDLYSNYADLEEALLGFKYLNNVYVDRQSEVDTLTNKINKAVKGLSLKKANYTKIEYLKSKISNLDPGRYENFYLVNNALNNIVYGLDITKQKEVDEMYNKLLEAFESLKRNGNDPADYTEYNKIVSTVPTFVKGYDKEKQEKINNLKKEINDFPMNLKLKEQSRIDNMVVKIKKVLSELNITYSSNLKVVTPVDTTLIKNIKINGNAIDISRMPFDYSVEYADKSANIEVEVIKNAKVFVYGGASLSYGENSIKIEVIYLDKIYNYELNIYRKSSSNYLKELKINTKGASFNSENFNKEKQDYIVKINNDVTRLDIEAIPEEETAKINIKNNYKLKDDSRVQIEVTSKDGSFRVYTLIIKKNSVVNYTFLIVLAVIFALLAVALKGLQNLSKKKSENE